MTPATDEARRPESSAIVDAIYIRLYMALAACGAPSPLIVTRYVDTDTAPEPGPYFEFASSARIPLAQFHAANPEFNHPPPVDPPAAPFFSPADQATLHSRLAAMLALAAAHCETARLAARPWNCNCKNCRTTRALWRGLTEP